MPPDELKDRLEKLADKAVREFPRLNMGGCGVFAAAVARELEQLGYESEVILPRRWDEPIETLRWIIQRNEVDQELHDFGSWCWHLMVRVRIKETEYIFDSDGLRLEELDDWEAVTPKEAQALADAPNIWNSCFPRKEVPKVCKLVKAILNEEKGNQS